MKLSIVGSSKFLRLWYGGLYNGDFKFCPSAGPFVDENLCRFFIQVRLTMLWRTILWFQTFCQVQESTWMKSLLVHPSTFCLGYGGQIGFKVCPLWVTQLHLLPMASPNLYGLPLICSLGVAPKVDTQKLGGLSSLKHQSFFFNSNVTEGWSCKVL
jgi:hypothetical protein